MNIKSDRSSFTVKDVSWKASSMSQYYSQSRVFFQNSFKLANSVMKEHG